MYRHSLALTAVVCSLLWTRAATAADPLPPRAAWIPQNAVVVLDLAQPRQLLNLLFDDRIANAVTASPQYQAAMANPELKQALGVVKSYQDRYQTDFRGLCGKLLGGGVTWAIGPNEASLLIVDTEDARLLEDIHEFIRIIARGEAEKRGEPNAVTSAEYRGVTGWRFGPNEAHAIIGSRLLLTNKPDWLKAAVDLKADPNGASVAKATAYRTAQQAVGASAVGSIYVDLAVLKQIPQLQEALSKNNENPLASLLVAPLLAAMRESNWLALGLSLQGQKLTFDLAMDSAKGDAPSKEFATPQTSQDGAMPNFAVPGQIASATFYRDLHRFYAAKDKLFPERTSGLIFFENMMGIFFTGRDLTDEVLAETTPHVRFLAAQQQYDSKVGTPQVQLPGFAAVFRMKNPDKFAPVAEEAFQKALGLINFTRGQKAEPGLIIDRPEYKGVKYTVAAFGPPAKAEQGPVDIRFNFQPTLAMPCGYVVISSTEALARDLIDALKAEAAGNVQPLAGMHTVLTVDGKGVAAILNANRESMIQQSMVENGKTHDQAAAEFDVGMKIAEAIRQVTLSMGNRGGQTHATFEMTVQVP